MVLLLFPTFFDIMKQALHIPGSAHRGSTENNRWGSPSPLSIAHKKSRFPGHWLLCSWKNSLKFRVAKSSKYRWEEKEGFMSLIPDPGLWDPLQTLQDSQTDSRPAESSSRLLTPPSSCWVESLFAPITTISFKLTAWFPDQVPVTHTMQEFPKYLMKERRGRHR